jgi:methionine-rich copper-binding protein CopC
MSRRTLIAASVTLSLFSAAPSAEAHPRLKASSPPADASIAPPQEIRLVFSEDLIAKLSGLDLKDQTGKLVETDRAAPDPGDKKQLIVRLKSPLVPGQYTVEWHVVSEDTHRVKGSYSFKVEP